MLTQCLYEYGRERYNAGNQGNMWRYFPEDEDSTKPVLPFLIKSIHPFIIRHLILGDLPYRSHKSQNTKMIVDREFRLTTVPGIYINFFCRQETDITAPSQAGSPPPDPDARKGFSVNEFKKIVQGMRLYLHQDRRGNEYAEEVDHSPAAIPIDTDYQNRSGGRRYAGSPSRIEKISDWCDVVDAFIAKAERDAPTLLTEHLLFCPASVGYGRNCQVRCNEHIGNKSTSALFGLFNAIRIKDIPGYEIQQYQVLHICDPAHANLAEATVSVLTSSYSSEVIGLNGKLGGALGHNNQKGLDQEYERNIRRLLENSGHRAIAKSADDAYKKLDVLPGLLNFDRARAARDIATEQQSLKEKYEETKKLAHQVDTALAQKSLMDLWTQFQ